MQRKYFDIHTSLGRKSSWDERFPVDPDTLVSDMAHYRVHGGLFVQNEGPEYNIFQGNKQGMKTAAQYKRLYSAATLIPSVEYEWDEPDYYGTLDLDCVKAIHIAPKKMKHPFTPGAMEKLCRWMGEKNLPLLVSASEVGWEELERFLDTYRNINVILTDTSWGSNRFLFSLLGRYPNLYFEISSNQANDILEVTKQYFGIHRALFGCNYPFKMLGGLKAMVEYARISEEEKDAVACDNACRLLHIDKSTLDLYPGEPDFDELATLMDQGKPLTGFPIIDAHAHMSADGHYSVSDLIMKNSDAKSMVKSMDDLGIDCTVTVPWEGISTSGTNGNITCQKAMKDFPGRFLSYASCNPNYAEELNTVIPRFHEKDKGFVGVKPYYPKHGYDILGERYKEWFEYANRRNLLLLLHTGVSGIHLKIPELCKRYPNISVLLAHSASNYQNADNLIEIVKTYDNTYLEITYTSLTRGIIEYMVEKVGADRVLFGTDTPMRDPAPQLAWIAYADISIEDKKKIMGGNMMKLLERIERD
ncbi:MAG TPA: hypothetical protein DDZ89_10645 [Clostridiales bacterium]|nr:hypothetical protein [Clostridiales bacterium]